MTYIRFIFVLYWFVPFLKFGSLPSENSRYAPETVSSDNKSQDFHDDPICIVRTPKKIYDSFKEEWKFFHQIK